MEQSLEQCEQYSRGAVLAHAQAVRDQPRELLRSMPDLELVWRRVWRMGAVGASCRLHEGGVGWFITPLCAGGRPVGPEGRAESASLSELRV